MVRYTLLPCLTLALLLFSGPSMQMVEPANASCCCAYCCPTWHNLMFGTITMLGNGKASIGTKEGSEVTVVVTAEVENEFLSQTPPVKSDFGFVITKVVTVGPPATVQVTAFVPVDREKHNQDFAGSAQSIVNDYNKAFEKNVVGPKKAN